VSSTPSIRHTTIRTYGNIGDFAKLDSSSTVPSGRSSAVAGDRSLAGSLNGVPCGSQSGWGCAVNGAHLPWRRALSRFFFAFPAAVR
jgi:hypothetical protein